MKVGGAANKNCLQYKNKRIFPYKNKTFVFQRTKKYLAVYLYGPQPSTLYFFFYNLTFMIIVHYSIDFTEPALNFCQQISKSGVT